MTEKPRETQAESHVVELKEKVTNSSLMKHLNYTVSGPSGRVRGCVLVVGTQNGVGRDGREAGNSPGMGGGVLNNLCGTVGGKMIFSIYLG